MIPSEKNVNGVPTDGGSKEQEKLGAELEGKAESLLEQESVGLKEIAKASALFSYGQLSELCENSFGKNETLRKIALLKFLFQMRQRLIRLLVICKWSLKHLPLVNRCRELLGSLSHHDTCFVQAADSLWLLHSELQQARAPLYDMPTAIEILSAQNFQMLPKCIEELKKTSWLTPSQSAPIIIQLDTLLRSRLLDVSIPPFVSSLRVAHGRVFMRVDGEYEIELTVGYASRIHFWKVLEIRLLVGQEKNEEGSRIRKSESIEWQGTKLTDSQHAFLVDDIQRRMAASEKNPLEIIHEVLHSLTSSLIMDILFHQARSLQQGRWKNFIQFEFISPSSLKSSKAPPKPTALDSKYLQPESYIADVVESETADPSKSNDPSQSTEGLHKCLKVVYWFDSNRTEPGLAAALLGRLGISSDNEENENFPYLLIQFDSNQKLVCSMSSPPADSSPPSETIITVYPQCINLEKILLQAISLSIHSRLSSIAVNLKSDSRLFSSEGDVILSNACDYPVHKSSHGGEEGKEEKGEKYLHDRKSGVKYSKENGSDTGEKRRQKLAIEYERGEMHMYGGIDTNFDGIGEVLCVRAFSDCYMTLGIFTKTGKFWLKSTDFTWITNIISELEDSLNSGMITPVDAFITLRYQTLMCFFRSLAPTMNLKVNVGGPSSVQLPMSKASTPPFFTLLSHSLLFSFPPEITGEAFFLVVQFDQNFIPFFTLLRSSSESKHKSNTNANLKLSAIQTFFSLPLIDQFLPIDVSSMVISRKDLGFGKLPSHCAQTVGLYQVAHEWLTSMLDEIGPWIENNLDDQREDCSNADLILKVQNEVSNDKQEYQIFNSPLEEDTIALDIPEQERREEDNELMEHGNKGENYDVEERKGDAKINDDILSYNVDKNDDSAKNNVFDGNFNSDYNSMDPIEQYGFSNGSREISLHVAAPLDQSTLSIFPASDSNPDQVFLTRENNGTMNVDNEQHHDESDNQLNGLDTLEDPYMHANPHYHTKEKLDDVKNDTLMKSISIDIQSFLPPSLDGSEIVNQNQRLLNKNGNDNKSRSLVSTDSSHGLMEVKDSDSMENFEKMEITGKFDESAMLSDLQNVNDGVDDVDHHVNHEFSRETSLSMFADIYESYDMNKEDGKLMMDKVMEEEEDINFFDNMHDIQMELEKGKGYMENNDSANVIDNDNVTLDNGMDMDVNAIEKGTEIEPGGKNQSDPILGNLSAGAQDEPPISTDNGTADMELTDSQKEENGVDTAGNNLNAENETHLSKDLIKLNSGLMNDSLPSGMNSISEPKPIQIQDSISSKPSEVVVVGTQLPSKIEMESLMDNSFQNTSDSKTIPVDNSGELQSNELSKEVENHAFPEKDETTHEKHAKTKLGAENPPLVLPQTEHSDGKPLDHPNQELCLLSEPDASNHSTNPQNIEAATHSVDQCLVERNRKENDSSHIVPRLSICKERRIGPLWNNKPMSEWNPASAFPAPDMTLGSLVKKSITGHFKSEVFFLYLSEAVRRSWVCIKLCQLSSQLKEMEIPFVEEVELKESNSLSLRFKLPEKESGVRKNITEVKKPWNQVRIDVLFTADCCWNVFISDNHYSTLYKMKKEYFMDSTVKNKQQIISENLNNQNYSRKRCRGSEALFSMNRILFLPPRNYDQHMACKENGLEMRFSSTESCIVEKMIRDVKRLRKSHSFTTSLLDYLSPDPTSASFNCTHEFKERKGERGYDEMGDEKFHDSPRKKSKLNHPPFSRSTSINSYLYEKGRNDARRKIVVIGIGFTELQISVSISSMHPDLIISITWPSASDGCKISTTPNNVWPQTKFLEEYVNEGLVELFVDAIRITSFPLYVLHKEFSSSVIPEKLGTFTLEKDESRWRPYLPSDFCLVLRHSYWLEIHYRHRYALDVRFFDGDHVWIQPACHFASSSGINSSSGSLPCPQFRPIMNDIISLFLSRDDEMENEMEKDEVRTTLTTNANGISKVQQSRATDDTPGGPGKAKKNVNVDITSKLQSRTRGPRRSGAENKLDLTKLAMPSDEGGYGGTWVPHRAFSILLRHLPHYLGSVWLFFQFPAILTDLIPGRGSSNAVIQDPEQPALRFLTGSCFYIVSLARLKDIFAETSRLTIQILNSGAQRSAQQQRQMASQGTTVPDVVLSSNELSFAESKELEELFNERIVSPPYDVSRVASFLTLIFLPVPVLRELLSVMTAAKRADVRKAPWTGSSELLAASTLNKCRVDVCLENKTNQVLHLGFHPSGFFVSSNLNNQGNIPSPMMKTSNIFYDKSMGMVDFNLLFEMKTPIGSSTTHKPSRYHQYLNLRLSYSFNDPPKVTLVNISMRLMTSNGPESSLAWKNELETRVRKAVEISGTITKTGLKMSCIQAVVESVQHVVMNYLKAEKMA